MNAAQWRIAPLRPEAELLAAELQLPLPIAQVLVNRGVLSPADAHTFLFGGFGDLHDPFLMAGMERAVSRIQQAVRQREKILIFGDYDVDGVLSVVILLKALRSLGGEVDYFIPERLKDGYGIKEAHIGVAKEKKARLVISVDCGIKASLFTARAKEEGMDVIITDHHRPGEDLPEPVALLNPVLQESSYPYRGLAGVGVVFKLLQALLARENRASSLPHYAKLVAIGTIADVAELRGENRILVRLGLKGLENVSNRGLRCLLDQCGLLDKKITEGDVGFRIAPRINAAGRLGDAEAAVRLFFSTDGEECLKLALRLSQLNARRQNEEDKIYSQAAGRIRDGALDKRYKLLALGCETWHRGIIGIVASKLKDFFYRPVLLFSYKDGKAHGSGRSISELSLIECLDECRDVFLDYGGHTLAVGCVLPIERMTLFRERINRVVDLRLREEDLRPKIRVDAGLKFSDIETPFIGHFLRLAPFGVGNPKPFFLSEKVEVAGPPQLIQGKHLKFLARQDGRVFEALGWDKGEWAPEIRRGDVFDIVYSLQISSYRGEETFGLSIEGLRASSG